MPVGLACRNGVLPCPPRSWLDVFHAHAEGWQHVALVSPPAGREANLLCGPSYTPQESCVSLPTQHKSFTAAGVL